MDDDSNCQDDAFDDTLNSSSHHQSPNITKHIKDLKAISSLFKKRITLISKTVVTNRIWLKCTPSVMCDVLITFPENTDFKILEKILKIILDAELLVNIKYHLNTRDICFYVSATYEKLLFGAENLKLLKPIKSNYGGGLKEFIFEEQEFYKNIENELLFLTTQEKQSIILDFLYQITDDFTFELGNMKIPPNQKILFWCKHHKIISQILPVHDHDELKELRSKWVISTKQQPLDKICNYFGVKLALYFGWLGFYTKSLIIPAILGLLIWSYSHSNKTIDSILFLVLCIFNLIWGACFCSLWKQRSAEYCYKWRTLDMEENLLQEPRPLFKGEYKMSKITGKIEPHYSEWKRTLFHYFVTLPCLALTIIFTILLMLIMFKLQDYFGYLTQNGYLPKLLGLTTFLPKMLYANIVGSLNDFYRVLSNWLNDKENYREQSTYENQLIIKIVSFQFINSYLSLFYIAFYLQNNDFLQQHLFAIFITKQLTGNFKESIIPYIKETFKQIKRIGKSKKEDYVHPSESFTTQLNKLQTVANESNMLRQKHNSASMCDTVGIDDKELKENKKCLDIADVTALSQPEVESMMPEYPDTFGDYLEMVLQYGLFIFFAPVFPLAAVCAFINNIIEIRSDAFKMCYLFQRPFGQRVPDIGKWQDVIELFTTVAVILNCIQLITSNTISSLFPNFGTIEIIVTVIIIEHIFLAFNKFLDYSIPKLPKWIVIEKCKLEYKRRAALRQIETTEIHNLKKQNTNS